MERPRMSVSRRWLWPIQIAMGAACIGLSISIIFSPTLGSYAFLLLAGAGLIFLGAERIAAGISSKDVKESSRIINVGIGAAIIVWIGSGFFYPQIAIKYLVLFLGFGLLANGVVRIIEGLKHRTGDSRNILPFGAGIASLAIAAVVLIYPPIGFVLLLIMTAVALAVSGIQVIIVGIRGSRRLADSDYERITTHPAEEKQPITSSGMWKNGTWFCDKEGRYLLFRGVNFASRSKLPPYLPIAPLDTRKLSELDLDSEIASTKKELDLLKDLGFNIVRLLISWKAIEPRPNPNLSELLPEGRLYLTYVKKIIDELYARNLYVILDFHQDIAHEVYGGDGFPDWALAIDEQHRRPEPANLKDAKWIIKYAVDKSLKQTLRSFWRNDLTNKDLGLQTFPVRTHLERTIGQTEKFFHFINNGKCHPAILGIEPFNEPHPVGLSKDQFEQEYLLDYYRNVNTELTSFGPDVFLFLEPRVDWTLSRGVDEESPLGPAPFSARGAFHMDLVKNVMVERTIEPKKIRTYLPLDMQSISSFGRNGVLSFHYYDPMAVASSFLKIPESMYTYKREWPAIFDQMVHSATERSLVPFLTEFGGYQEAEQVRDYLDLLFKEIEAHLLNSTYWNYDLYHTKEGKDNWNLEDYSLLGSNRIPRNIDIVARPYPLCSSSKPFLLFFDHDSKYATIILRGQIVDAPTIIYVPNIHYAPKFYVWATGKIAKWDLKNQHLYWHPEKKKEINQIIITKSEKLDPNNLPAPARDLPNDLALVGTFT